MGVIFFLSSGTGSDLSRQLEVFALQGDLRNIVGHLALYGVLGFLLLVSLWSWVGDSTFRLRWVLVGVGLGVMYGITDEYHQSYVTDRSASGFDVLVDSAGVASGWLAVIAVRARRLHA